MILPLTAVAQTFLTCGEWRAQEPPVASSRSAIEEDASGENEAWIFAFSLGLVRWDGVDPSGRAMPSGGCLVSLRGDGVYRSRQIVLVRQAHDRTEKRR